MRALRSKAEFTTAIELVVEAILFEQFVATLLQTTLPPVSPIEGDAGGGEASIDCLCSPLSRLVDLLDTLPAT